MKNSSVEYDTITRVITLENVQVNDSGIYTCSVTLDNKARENSSVVVKVYGMYFVAFMIIIWSSLYEVCYYIMRLMLWLHFSEESMHYSSFPLQHPVLLQIQISIRVYALLHSSLPLIKRQMSWRLWQNGLMYSRYNQRCMVQFCLKKKKSKDEHI